MRIVCISDTHGRHDAVNVPAGDVLVHAGDLTMKGDVEDVFAGFAWLSKLPHERIVFVPGNHDFAFERAPEIVHELAATFPGVEVLMDGALEVGGYRVYGSPYQPWFGGWAFNFARGEAGAREAEERWARIPADTEILITHGPVHGILDRTDRGVAAGCPQLLARLEHLENLKLHSSEHGRERLRPGTRPANGGAQ
jgi:predicted phosphodiesterase